jgi:predicted RNA-binding protein with EMAP domain
MRFGINEIKTMSNHALFTIISNKKQAIENLQNKKLASKLEEVEYCYLVRERQRRFHKTDKHPECCLS